MGSNPVRVTKKLIRKDELFLFAHKRKCQRNVFSAAPALPLFFTSFLNEAHDHPYNISNQKEHRKKEREAHYAEYDIRKFH